MTTQTEPTRRLSLWRVLLAIVLLIGLSYAGYWTWQSVRESLAASSVKPWFAPYVDVTAKPTYAFEQSEAAKSHSNLVLSFIVSSKTDACIPSWGGFYTLDEANTVLDLDRRIARYKQQGGTIAVSFGGLLNDELSFACKDPSRLLTAYQQVLDRYDIDTIDLDLEGPELADAESLKRRAAVIANLQTKRRSDHKKLAVWLTLPVSTHGLAQEGTGAVSTMLASGVDLAGVNAMTMDYGASREQNQTMQEASETALTETHRQLGVLYKQAGITLSNASLWVKIGATPMIGQNDTPGEVFTSDDAKGFNTFATSKGIARMSIWSANRDVACGENYVNRSTVSDSCSGVKQGKFSFSLALGKGFYGSIRDNSSLVTAEDPETKQTPDDPLQSPYQIWTEKGTYLEGTKVVWHKNVYQAKWWTKGDLPDNPVLQVWETPWQLVGPVLPGEKPVPQPKLPEGTYPTWSGTDIYNADQRVLFDGIPYHAKWWTQGDSPAASTSNPDSSPWVVLTREDVDEVISGIEQGIIKPASPSATPQ